MRALLAVVLALHAEAGWFDDAFALDGAGGRLAVVHVAPDGGLELQLRDLGQGGAVVGRARLATAPSTVAFTRGGVLVGGGGAATLYDDAGRPRARFGPATDVVAGDERIAVYDRQRAEITLYDGEHPQRPLVKRSLGKLPDFEPLYFAAGYTRAVGRHRGRYDRGLDRRLPDTEGSYDVERGTFTDRPIDDPVAWTRLARERAARPNQDTFVRTDGGLAAVTADDRAVPLALAGALGEVEPGPDGQLVLEVAGELYRFDPAAADPGRPAHVGSVAPGAVWHVAGGRLAVLGRRSSGRGGVDLTVQDLGH